MNPKQPITVARLERALDRLAVIIDEDPAIATYLLPMFQLLEEEHERVRAQVSDLERVRARARRIKERFPRE